MSGAHFKPDETRGKKCTFLFSFHDARRNESKRQASQHATPAKLVPSPRVEIDTSEPPPVASACSVVDRTRNRHKNLAKRNMSAVLFYLHFFCVRARVPQDCYSLSLRGGARRAINVTVGHERASDFIQRWRSNNVRPMPAAQLALSLSANARGLPGSSRRCRSRPLQARCPIGPVAHVSLAIRLPTRRR